MNRHIVWVYAWLFFAGVNGGAALRAAIDGRPPAAVWFLIATIGCAWLSGFGYGDRKAAESA